MPRSPRSPKPGLLIIDMINEFNFHDAAKLFPAIEQTAKQIAELKREIKAHGLPVIYVNDNFGKWQSDFRKLVTRCLHDQCRGRTIAEVLLPNEDDYFVLKPKHSGFYGTPLELLLGYLEVGRVIITGVAGDNCVLFTAADAYMREFEVAVPSDCVISIDADANRSALNHMRATLKAEISPSGAILTQLAA
jgi:nicotinamidase-related amidase